MPWNLALRDLAILFATAVLWSLAASFEAGGSGPLPMISSVLAGSLLGLTWGGSKPE